MPEHILPSLPDDLPVDRTVGVTTTVPTEVIFAAGLIPIDLNNLFITSEDPQTLADEAERAGFPRTCCCWTKGLYGAVMRYGIRRVVGVARGDCSNAEALMEVLRHEGVETIPFNYPASQDQGAAKAAVREFADALGARIAIAEKWRSMLAPHRALAAEIDGASWEGLRVHGLESHVWLVSTSDFCADPDRYLNGAEAFLDSAAAREPLPHALRLGLCGVPPIVPEIYDFCEEFGGLIVFNETQRQFAMPNGGSSLAEQYARYTYPYGLAARLSDIRAECGRRRLDGLIHYVQSFCHRRIEDRIVRDSLNLPILTLEADRPGSLSGQIKTRLESFLQMLTLHKRRRN